MKKQEIYVPIANKKEAKRTKAVLEAMGEVIDENYFRNSYDENEGGLYFNEKYKTWIIAISFRHYSDVRTKTTLKQLIELLVSEQQAEPEKIAVRVDNEKEFNALMKYYDSLGWKSKAGNSPKNVSYNKTEPIWCFNDGFGSSFGCHTDMGYKIIPFSEFAKEHGIRVPLYKTHDGVDLYEGSEFFIVGKLGSVIDFSNPSDYPIRTKIVEVGTGQSHEPSYRDDKGWYWAKFSTKQAALDWIEAQKPKEVVIEISQGLNCIVSKKEIDFPTLELCITKEDLKSIHKAMEELNS